MKKFLCYDTVEAARGEINVNENGMLKPYRNIPIYICNWEELGYVVDFYDLAPSIIEQQIYSGYTDEDFVEDPELEDRLNKIVDAEYKKHRILMEKVIEMASNFYPICWCNYDGGPNYWELVNVYPGFEENKPSITLRRMVMNPEESITITQITVDITGTVVKLRSGLFVKDR